jgi:hypothetical protein
MIAVPVKNAGLAPGSSQYTAIPRSSCTGEKGLPAQPWEEAPTLRALPQKAPLLHQPGPLAHLTALLNHLCPPTTAHLFTRPSAEHGGALAHLTALLNCLCAPTTAHRFTRTSADHDGVPPHCSTYLTG